MPRYQNETYHAKPGGSSVLPATMLPPVPECAGAREEVGRPAERAGRPESQRSSSTPSSQPGPRTDAPAATHRPRSSRSAVTTTRGPDSSRTRSTIASSPEPRASITRTGSPPAGDAGESAGDAANPAFAAPSTTSTTSGASAAKPGTVSPDAQARTSRSRSRTAAPARSRHQPSGRDPITFAPSTTTVTTRTPPSAVQLTVARKLTVWRM